jgi:hypothetical protein
MLEPINRKAAMIVRKLSHLVDNSVRQIVQEWNKGLCQQLPIGSRAVFQPTEAYLTLPHVFSPQLRETNL